MKSDVLVYFAITVVYYCYLLVFMVINNLGYVTFVCYGNQVNTMENFVCDTKLYHIFVGGHYIILGLLLLK